MTTVRLATLAAAAVSAAACGNAPAIDVTVAEPNPPTTAAPPTTVPPVPIAPDTTATTRVASLLPCFGAPERLLGMSGTAEPFLSAGDSDGDGDPDIAVTRLRFQTRDTFPLEIYLQEGDRLVRATPQIFIGAVPTVQQPADRIVADLDGDGIDDLYVGNVRGGDAVGPQIWLNDGSGRFSAVQGAMPPKRTPSDLVHDIETADLDGDLDLVEAGFSLIRQVRCP